MTLLLNIFKNYANFKGRVSRREFWLSVAVLFCALAVFYIFFSLLAALFGGLAGQNIFSYQSFQALSIMAKFIAFLFLTFGYILPVLALAARRLHDINLSFTWLFCGAFLGAFAFLCGFWTLLLAVKILFIILLCLPSQKTANRYGPEPK
ncbi:MAG: DUF805 domain-containing protein [Elusimicrobiota bacterium]|jgi:uncharacterized membrane protein YhaH (DUF805 family)|nr:DUF805 domain-containing protein [Elusimicrobiota bacterium]